MSGIKLIYRKTHRIFMPEVEVVNDGGGGRKPFLSNSIYPILIFVGLIVIALVILVRPSASTPSDTLCGSYNLSCPDVPSCPSCPNYTVICPNMTCNPIYQVTIHPTNITYNNTILQNITNVTMVGYVNNTLYINGTMLSLGNNSWQFNTSYNGSDYNFTILIQSN